MDVRDLTIGEFGRRTGLSPKALRLYEVSGLLRPASVDPATGYRRYNVEQVERARRISLLRQLDMPLAVVAEVLHGDDTEAAIRLDRWWQAQEAQVRSRRASADYLRAQLTRGGPDRTPYPVHLLDRPRTKVASITRDCDQQSLVPTMAACVDKLGTHVRAAGADSAGERWLLFYGHVTPDSEATVEICLPFTGTVEPTDDIVIRIEPAQTLAAVTVPRKDCFYPKIMLAYDDVQDHVHDKGLTAAGVSREIYFAEWCDIGDDDPFVHVAVPVQTTMEDDRA
ncbi:DNA-binding transcriptional regulator, MerR family [Asanoa hainanensis]|uniref:DNA-binding transcriptional regulator, MerR family n=1 Tax=Asanoa hainanensis TaxID=560556 RepID=A0A239LEF0_9ACTN|nr:MerR family transcriptional regulator [Asanoa hainanensis]SNT27914.1 DNA-binding transcriptional regulator, MerR family [Asanoa hainanensis]